MITVLTGKNLYEIQKEASKLIDDFIDKHGDSIERFDGSEIDNSDALIDAVRSVSFLEPRKMVVVRDFAQSKALLERVELLIESTADTTDLVLIDPKLDKRTAEFKMLKKSTQLKEFKELEPYLLEKWAVAEAEILGSTLKNNDAKYLVELIGPNQQMLKSEIDKLAISSKTITRDLINQLIEATPQSKVFALLDYLFNGEANKAWSIYLDQRAQGEEPHKILSMIVWQLQQLVTAMYVPNNSKETLIADGMSPYSAKKSLDMVKKIDKATLKFLVNELSELELQSKTSADIESALALYFSEVLVA